MNLPRSVLPQLPRPQRFPSSYLSRVETLVETVSEHIFWKNKELAEETRSANLAVAAFVKVGAKCLETLSWICLALAALLTHALSVSSQRCFTLMDRGFTFKLISNYVNMITATDSKVKIHPN